MLVPHRDTHHDRELLRIQRFLRLLIMRVLESTADGGGRGDGGVAVDVFLATMLEQQLSQEEARNTYTTVYNRSINS